MSPLGTALSVCLLPPAGEAELTKVRREMEEAQLASEQQLASLKKKSQDAVNDLTDQLDNVSKVKAK